MAGMKVKKPAKKKPGPMPGKLKLDGNWKDLIKRALQKQRPKDGWPEI
jgi:hypothetical protein